MINDKIHFETLQLHGGLDRGKDGNKACAVPIYQTAAYVFNSCQDADDRFQLREPGCIYGRLNNPTQDALERRIAALEGGTGALAVASGAAAVTYALENVLLPGDHIVAGDNLYGGTYNLIVNNLAKRGIGYTIVNLNDEEALKKAIRPDTKVIYGETFGNPNSDVTDIDMVARVAHEHNAIFIIDNTFGTPCLIRPIEHGADVVVHSATKFIGGHGTSLGGVIVDGGHFDYKAFADRFPTLGQPDGSYHGTVFADTDPVSPFVTRARCVVLRDEGACISPFNAFLLLQGLETLSLRVERHVANTLKIVRYLAGHPRVRSVSHPSLPSHPDNALYSKYYPAGGGSIFTFDIEGGRTEAWEFLDRLKLFTLLANVADSRSLAIHPASTTHSQMNETELAKAHISQSTVRLSIGLEHADDLIADLEQALAR